MTSKEWFHLKFFTQIKKKRDNQTTVLLSIQHSNYTALEPESKTNSILIKYINCLNIKDTGTAGNFKNIETLTNASIGSLLLILY